MCRSFRLSRQMTPDSAARTSGQALTWPSGRLFAQSQGEKTFSSRNGLRYNPTYSGKFVLTPKSGGKAVYTLKPGQPPRRSGAEGGSDTEVCKCRPPALTHCQPQDAAPLWDDAAVPSGCRSFHLSPKGVTGPLGIYGMSSGVLFPFLFNATVNLHYP